ncbi:MAG: SDR family oxidoreductase, partial [Bacilli bacterium]|nr:SDR family oxidoreductase [Bacilli bacterium]
PYYNETNDALNTKRYIESLGGQCHLIMGDITDRGFCKQIVNETLKKYGKIDILVNNAGVQYQQDCLENISDEQFDWTMKVNVYGMFYLTKEVLPYLKSGSSIINLSSVTTFYGDPQLIDYVTTKGAIVGFTRALARNLALKNIRVNAIAPGFFWTPLQPACWVAEKIPSLGAEAAMARGAMPYELAPTFVYLASNDSSYVTGQVFHINGGQVMD